MAIPFDAEEIREALNAEIGDIIGKDAEAIVRAVVLATPVGNPSLWKGIPPPGYKPGRARGAWRINFGRADGRDIGKHDTTGGTTIATAFQRIRVWAKSYGKIGRAPGLILENNRPYIGRLNNGWSTQAPAGFVEKAVAIARGRSRAGESKELP